MGSGPQPTASDWSTVASDIHRCNLPSGILRGSGHGRGNLCDDTPGTPALHT